jgi:hypothetical protein
VRTLVLQDIFMDFLWDTTIENCDRDVRKIGTESLELMANLHTQE